MAKTDFSNDLTKSYSSMDVVLVKNKGLIPWMQRFNLLGENDPFDEVFLYMDSGLYHIDEFEVFTRACLLSEWRGRLNLIHACSVINLKERMSAEKVARESVGHHFPSTVSAIAFFFGLDKDRNDINYLISKKQ